MELVVSLLVIGAILLILETVLPGAIAGVLGVCCLVAGVAVSYSRFGFMTGNWVLGGVLAGVVIGFVLWLRFFPESRLGRKFVSDDSVGDIRAERPELLHQTGEAFTQLRPSGTALINGRRVDVVTEGGLIERGTPIKVVAIEGMRVVVRPLPGESK
jgi:membrane-bound serine protease (ClpP class)